MVWLSTLAFLLLMFNISGKMYFEARPVSSPEYWNGAPFLLDVVGLLIQFHRGNIVITDNREMIVLLTLSGILVSIRSTVLDGATRVRSSASCFNSKLLADSRKS